MLADRLADAPTLLMAGALAAYAVIVVRVAMRDAARARRQRAVANWRTLPQTRTAAHHQGARGGGWSALQRHRIDRRRRLGARAAW